MYIIILSRYPYHSCLFYYSTVLSLFFFFFFNDPPPPDISSLPLHAALPISGANRLASNSLLECVVYAHRVAERAREVAAETPLAVSPPAWNPGQARNPDEQVVIAQNWDEKIGRAHV